MKQTDRSVDRERGLVKAILLVGVLSLVGIGIVVHLASGRKPEPVKRAETVPVTVAQAVTRDVPVAFRAIGWVEPYARVTIKARVSGELKQVHFREGQEVKAGDLLLTIDPRPYEMALQEAEARLARDESLADKAEKDLQRYETLVSGGYISREQYDQARANAQALRATVALDRTQVETARLNLDYCRIHAPISGRMGSLLMDQGSMIKANDDKGIVDIFQIQPVNVDFSLPEQHLPEVKKSMARGPVKVEATVSGQEGPAEIGELVFMDSAVDRQTGTIKLRSMFQNRNRRLWPGQYIKVLMTLRVREGVTTIPSKAIQKGQEGEFVFVVKADFTVEARPVSAGLMVDQEAVIEKGVSPGEQVVTDGQLRLVQGSRVQVK
jgi:multidrug efflux system membrane fusion protein